MQLTSRIRRFLQKLRPDDLILGVGWLFLVSMVVVGIIRLLRPWINPTLDWIDLTVALIALFLATELTFRFLLRRRYRSIQQDPAGDFRMEPHIFTHFVPSRRYADVSEEGFRSTGALAPAPGGGP